MKPVLLVAAAALAVAGAGAQETISLTALTAQQAVAIALGHHPSLRAAEAGVRSADAGLTQARSSYYPAIVATASASRTDGAFVFNPDFPPRNQTYNNYSAGVSISQTIFDFGKTIGRVSANGAFDDAARDDARAAGGDVTMNAATAYAGLVQAKLVVAADQEALDQAQKHLREAQAYFSVGKRAQLDVTRAEVDVANANVAFIQARNDLRLARLGLENAMGVRIDGQFTVADSLDILPFDLSLDSVHAIMAANSPELSAARARVDANGSLVTAAWAQNLPTLSATGAWTWSAFDFPLFSRGNAALTLSLPLFQGFNITAQVDQARAGREAAEANEELLREALRTATEQNYLNVREAEERLGATSKLVEQAAESLNLAERQYAAGVGSAIEVSDAQLTLTNARITRIRATYDYSTSLVKLQRSMGVLGGTTR